MEPEQSKWALVTGGNRGIGFAIAQGLLAKGWEVIISARSLDCAEQANVPSYCLSKFALNGATVMLAEALYPREIVVRDLHGNKIPAMRYG